MASLDKTILPLLRNFFSGTVADAAFIRGHLGRVLLQSEAGRGSASAFGRGLKILSALIGRAVTASALGFMIALLGFFPFAGRLPGPAELPYLLRGNYPPFDIAWLVTTTVLFILIWKLGGVGKLFGKVIGALVFVCGLAVVAVVAALAGYIGGGIWLLAKYTTPSDREVMLNFLFKGQNAGFRYSNYTVADEFKVVFSIVALAAFIFSCVRWHRSIRGG